LVLSASPTRVACALPVLFPPNLNPILISSVGCEKNEVEAIQWLKKSAESGYADGQFNLAVCYAAGLGVPKDEKYLKPSSSPHPPHVVSGSLFPPLSAFLLRVIFFCLVCSPSQRPAFFPSPRCRLPPRAEGNRHLEHSLLNPSSFSCHSLGID
jgi:hypothetical protein